MCLAQKLDIKMVFWTLIVCLLLLCGISIFCIWECFRMKARYEGYSSFMISRMATTTGVIIALFIVVVILAMTALVSVILDCYPMLIIHAYIFIVLSFVMFSIGMFGVIQNRDQDGKGSYLIKSLADLESVLERPDWFSFNHTILDPIQKELRCCGVYNWNDYWRPLKRTSWIGDMLPLPKTCCDDQTIVCMPVVKSHRQDGCMVKVASQSSYAFTKYSALLTVFSISVGIDAAFLFILARKAKEYYYFYPYYM